MDIKPAQDPIFRCATMLLVLLFCGDLLFIAAHLANGLLREVPNPLLDIAKDKSHPEFYGYIKFIWIAILLFHVGIKQRSFLLSSWILVFGYLLVDDSMRLHEEFGADLAEHFGMPRFFGLRPKDLGELCISAGSGVILIGALALAWWRGDEAFRRLSLDLFALLGLVVFFGVGIDLVHVFFDSRWWLNFTLGTLEDAGEMISVSLIVWFVFRVAAVGNPGSIHLLGEIRAWWATRRR